MFPPRANSTARNTRRIILLKALAHPSRLAIADAQQDGLVPDPHRKAARK